MRFLVVGGALWLYVIVTLVLHAVDIRRRSRLRLMPLSQYRRARPFEFAMAGLVGFGGVVAALDGMVYWEARAGGADELATSSHLILGLGFVALVLCFVGVRGVNRAMAAREEFLNAPGATIPNLDEVQVNVEQEALRDGQRARLWAWPLYGLAAAVLLGSARLATATVPQAMPLAVSGALFGAALTLLIVLSLPKVQTDKDEW